MTARELRGAPVAAALSSLVAVRAAKLARFGRPARLAIVRVGERPGDLAYERAARVRMDKVGIACETYELISDVSRLELERLLRDLADDAQTDAILVLRPLPAALDEAALSLVPAIKDVDGMTPASRAATFASDEAGFVPCTAEAVVRLLEYYGVKLAGQRAVVLGRSLVVGRPLAELLLARDATLTVCHSRTTHLAAECRRADILVSCMGRARAITAEMVSPGAVVVDVGTSVKDDGIVGDVDYEAVSEVASAITPVPGGVGSLTTSVLALHVVEAAERVCNFT